MVAGVRGGRSEGTGNSSSIGISTMVEKPKSSMMLDSGNRLSGDDAMPAETGLRRSISEPENARGLSKAPTLSFSSRIGATGKLIRKTYLKGRPRGENEKFKNKTSVLSSLNGLLATDGKNEEASGKEKKDSDDDTRKSFGIGKMLKNRKAKKERAEEMKSWAALEDDSEEEGLLQNQHHYDDADDEPRMEALDPFSKPMVGASLGLDDDESSVESSVEAEEVPTKPASMRSMGGRGRKPPVSIRERRRRGRSNERFSTFGGDNDVAPIARRSSQDESSSEESVGGSRNPNRMHHSFAPGNDDDENDSDTDLRKPSSIKSMPTTRRKPRKISRKKDSHKSSEKKSRKYHGDEDDEGTRISAASSLHSRRSKSGSPNRKIQSTRDLLSSSSSHSRYKSRKSLASNSSHSAYHKKKAPKGSRDTESKLKRLSRAAHSSSPPRDDEALSVSSSHRKVRRVKSGDGLVEPMHRRNSGKSIDSSVSGLRSSGKDRTVRRTKSGDGLLQVTRSPSRSPKRQVRRIKSGEGLIEAPRSPSRSPKREVRRVKSGDGLVETSHRRGSTRSIDSSASGLRSSAKSIEPLSPSRKDRAVRRTKSGDGLLQATQSPSRSPKRQVRRVKSSDLAGHLERTFEGDVRDSRSVSGDSIRSGRSKRGGGLQKQNSASELRQRYKGVSNRRRQAELEEKRQQELKLEKEREKVLAKEKEIQRLQKKLATVSSESDDDDSSSDSGSSSESDGEWVPAQPMPSMKLKW